MDTADTMIVFETALEPRLYVDPSLVRTDLLQRSETTSYCNYKGYATYWSAVVVTASSRMSRGAMRIRCPRRLPIRGYLSFDTDAAEVVAELPASAGAADCGCAL